MRKLIEFQILDKNALHYGIDLSKLMDNAGATIANYIIQNHKNNVRIAVVCGSGNNGGDGYVASSLLIAEGFDLTVFQSSIPTSTIAKNKYAQLEEDVKNIS